MSCFKELLVFYFWCICPHLSLKRHLIWNVHRVLLSPSGDEILFEILYQDLDRQHPFIISASRDSLLRYFGLVTSEQVRRWKMMRPGGVGLVGGLEDTGRWLHSASNGPGLLMLFYDFGISYPFFFIFYLWRSALAFLAYCGCSRAIVVYQF